MFCSKCGSEIQTDERFCAVCGAPNDSFIPPEAPEPVTAEPVIPAEQPVPEAAEPVAPAEQPAPEAAEPVAPAEQPAPKAAMPAVPANQPAPGYAPTVKKGLGKGAIIGIVAAALVLLALVSALIFGLVGGAKARVGAAAAKSIKAYASAADSVGMPDLVKLYADKQVTHSGSIELRSLANIPSYYYDYIDTDALKGLGARFTVGYDLSGRKIDASGTAYYGSADLISAEAKIDDTIVSAYIPELFDDTAYGLDTSTLGKDLENLELYLPDGYEKLSFNIFDLIEQLDFELPKVDKKATKALISAIEVDRIGRSSIAVNGNSVKCTQYHVVIPKSAMRDYIDALKDAYGESDYSKNIIRALRSAGIAGDELAYLEEALKSGYDQGSNVFTSLRDAVKEFGDLKFDVYVKGGYVMAAVWKGRIDDSRAEIGLYLGGGKRYVDDLSVELRGDDGRFTISSSGNHAAKGGTFTDSTTLRYRDDWSDETIKSELEYEPKKSSDNFSWRVKADGETFKAKGELNMSKTSLDLQLDELSLSNDAGEKEFSAKLGWYVGPYSEQKFSASKTQLISSMNRDSLEYLYEDISNNAERWGNRMYDKYEDVFDFLDWLF